MRTLLRIIAFLALMQVAARGQSIPYSNAAYQPGTGWMNAPADFAIDLKNPGGIRVGNVWLRQFQNGVVVFGRVSAPRLKWARFPAEFASKGQIDLKLSFTENVPMPEIGWASQSGTSNCELYAEAQRTQVNVEEDCATWSARQTLYREQLRRLFLREWKLAPGVSSETMAAAAYPRVLAFTDNFGLDILKRLYPNPLLSDPSSMPSVDIYNVNSDWSFEAFLPWASLPPASSLDLSRIHIVVEIADGTRKVGSTAPNHKAVDPATYNHLTFRNPRTYSIGRCGYVLPQAVYYSGKRDNGWYFPSAASEISDAFVLINDAVGYRYDPEGLSPVPQWNHFFSKNLGNNNVVCGTSLRFLANGKLWQPDAAVTIDQAHLEHFRLPDGSYLLKSGPTMGTYSPFGTGRCGACTTFQVSVYHLDPKNGISRAFAGMVRIDPSEVVDGDIQISTDWKTITVYIASEQSSDSKKSTIEWSSTRHCLVNGKTYEKCGAGPAGPPPKPRQIPSQLPPGN